MIRSIAEYMTFIILLVVQSGYSQAVIPDNYRLQSNVTYVTVDTWQGKLDVYVPMNLKRNLPLVINIHGGGWVHGTKETETDFTQFLTGEFVVANVEYRLAHQSPAPAAIEDARCALIFLVNNAEQYRIDRNKIVIMGGSAGGHLALMAGLLPANSLFDTNCMKQKSYRVACIIDKYGPTDLNKWDSMRKPGKASSSWLGGRGNDTLFVQSLSPVSYVTKKAPPIFIIHGNDDHTVPYEQSSLLFAALKKVNAVTEMYTVKGGKHGNFSQDEKNRINVLIKDFVAHALSRSKFTR